MSMRDSFRLPLLKPGILFLVGLVGIASASPWSAIGDAVDFLSLSKPELSRRPAHRALEFGDFAETPDTCPARTTCPLVCVVDATECPTACGSGLVLCNDGVCSESCDDEIETPCFCDDLPVACAKVVDLYDACFESFQDFYDEDAACQEAQDDEIPLLSFTTEPAFIFCYAWISGITVAVVLWCALNQRLFPVADSTMPLASASGSSREDWTHTGYNKNHAVGLIVHILVILTFIGIQFLLFLLTIFYYMQQEAITRWSPVFYDEVQVLKAFEIVWMVGFVWCFAFKYPASIRSLFLRRCPLERASHVAVVAPTQAVDVASDPGVGDKVAGVLWAPFDFVLGALFSYPYCRPGLDTTFCEVETDKQTGTRSFYHRMRRYVFDAEAGNFVPGTMDVGSTFGDFLGQVGGLTTEEVTRRTGLAGPNVIPMEKPTILGSIVKEFSKGFYLYQNFMVWTWAPYWYYYMAIVNSVVRLSGGIVVGVFQYLSDSKLHQISHVEGEVEVLRDGTFVTISVTDLVPGDVVVITPGTTYCDMVVIKANHLLVDESALTGEAIPVVKTEADPTMKSVTYNPDRHKSNTISAGTNILEVGESEKELGLVLKTGSFTTKGELLSDVLSYQRHKFQFDDEVKVVIFILVLEAMFLLGMVFHFLQDQWVYAWFYGVFVLGTIIPPLLPTVFVVSVGISTKRLQKKRITCTNPEGILAAGMVDAAFFDKTGTLTKQGMDFISLDSGFGSEDNTDDHFDARIRLGMAVCHTLTTTSEGEIVGNQVDKVSFESTGAVLDDKGIAYSGKDYTVLKKYEFDTHRATQSVIVEGEDGTKLIFVKGSPEAIRALCRESTVPNTFDERVRMSAKSGVYQIAIAFKDFDFQDSIAEVSRDDVEKLLTFGGFINFQNVMKEDTPGVLEELVAGDVSVAMITGDSVLTGICIARESGMIKADTQVILGSKAAECMIEWTDADTEESVDMPSGALMGSLKSDLCLAVSGEVWALLRENDPTYASMIAKHVRVFGRCNPTDKVSVVSLFVENGFITLMCGDGQNDCGALKSAHVGIALSSSEASIVSPFTSLDKSITSVPEVLREGRCALASAFAAYSYYIIYGQVEAYLQTINAYLAITFTEWCWVFLDGVWSITMAFSLPLSKAAKRLSPSRPTASLLGPHTLFSVCGILAWNFLYLVIALLALWSQDWFQCRKWDSDDVSNVLTIGDNYESTVLFVVGGYQYIASAIALNFGYAFREAYWKNYVFLFLSTLWTVFQFVMTLYPSSFSCIWRVNCSNEDAVRWVTSLTPVAINNPWNTTVMPIEFRWILVGIMAANLVTLMAWEYFFVNGILPKLAQKLTVVAPKAESIDEIPSKSVDE